MKLGILYNKYLQEGWDNWEPLDQDYQLTGTKYDFGLKWQQMRDRTDNTTATVVAAHMCADQGERGRGWALLQIRRALGKYYPFFN